MKIQNLAVIFIIIILPISIVISTYTGRLIDVAKIQADYDSLLLNSTYDAIRAYQMNTLNNDYEDQANSKVRDINASINSFFNSLSVGLSQSSYTKNELSDYIPAILYTLYDGYYVYSTYGNAVNTIDGIKYNTDSAIGKKEYGLKPFIRYSCEYASTNYDLIVNYTLDNYITVTGWYNDGTEKNISASGYYVNYNNIRFASGGYGSLPTNIPDLSGKNVTIKNSKGEEVRVEPETLGEYLITIDTRITNEGTRYVLSDENYDGTETDIETGNIDIKAKAKYYNYITYNNIKYYFDDIQKTLTRDSNGRNTSFNMSYDNIPIFFLDGDKRTYISTTTFNEIKNHIGVSDINISNYKNNFKDVNAYYYYYNAAKFSMEAYPALSNINLGWSNDEYGNRVIASNKNNINETGNVIRTESYHTKYQTAKGVSSHIKSTYSTPEIFKINEDNNPEEESSAFNSHRMDVIISSIESSLMSAVHNFNHYIGSTYEYMMPVLNEEEWDKICNNLTVVSFMQGLSIENYKYYSSYAVVANTKTKDFISRESIYVQDDVQGTEAEYRVPTREYHDPRCKNYNTDVTDNLRNVIGYRSIDYDRKSCKWPNDEGTESRATYWYYLQSGTAGYECNVGQNDNIYTSDELLTGILTNENETKGINEPNIEVRKAYITALAREKGNSYNMYKFLNI